MEEIYSYLNLSATLLPINPFGKQHFSEIRAILSAALLGTLFWADTLTLEGIQQYRSDDKDWQLDLLLVEELPLYNSATLKQLNTNYRKHNTVICNTKTKQRKC